MKIYICDDNKAFLDEFSTLIKKYDDKNNIAVFDTYDSFINAFNTEKPDLIFMDIVLDEINGIEAVTKLKEIKNDLMVIYISNYPDYVFESFETEPLTFLTKPIAEAKLSVRLTEQVRS